MFTPKPDLNFNVDTHISPQNSRFLMFTPKPGLNFNVGYHISP